MSQDSLNMERLAGRYRYLERARLLPLPSKDGITIVVELSHPEWAVACLQLLLLHSGTPVRIIAVCMNADFSLEALSEQFSSEQSITFVPYENGNYMPNETLAQVETTFVVLLEDSIMVSPGWLNELIWPALEDTSVMVIAPHSSTERVEGKERVRISSHDELTTYLNHRLEQRQGEWHEVDVLTGSCLLFAKDLLIRIGGFDRTLKSRHLMIADWCLRARQLSARLALCDAVYVHNVHTLQKGLLWMDEETIETKTEGWKAYSSKWALEGYEVNGSEDDECLVPVDLSVYLPQPVIPLGHSPAPSPSVTAIVYFEETTDSHALKQQWKVMQEQQTYKEIRWIWVRDKLAEMNQGYPTGDKDVVITVHGEDAWLRALKNAALLHESEITMYLSATTKYDTSYVERVVEAMVHGSADLILSVASHLDEAGTPPLSDSKVTVLPLDRVAYRGGTVPGVISRKGSALHLLPESSLALGYIGEAQL